VGFDYENIVFLSTHVIAQKLPYMNNRLIVVIVLIVIESNLAPHTIHHTLYTTDLHITILLKHSSKCQMAIT